MTQGFRSLSVMFAILAALLPWCDAYLVVAADAIITGPETEKRFPPLVVPDGFQATLFACDPLVEYPSVISLGPAAGSLFVAYDYMTGLGYEIVRRDEIRIVSDTNGDGYADQSTLYADGFNSIQGLAYHSGSVYVMHAPLLTRLQDTNGDGVADERRDLLNGLGLPPEENDNRLHCANGVIVGHDGWLYLALGDRGCDVLRPEGDRLVFREGGILRCHSDGRDLHVFSHGLRNIYDVVLDEDLNVFVRDNENDGGDYMIRVCHCFYGSNHGYPYLYNERPAEAMHPLADLGRGSSAGGTAYLETAFPPAYRESLYFCEWGRGVVRYRRQRAGSGFADMDEEDFVTSAPDDPYGFRPTDLVVDRDGSLLISDWADGQRPKRGRGRIYRIAHTGGGQRQDRAKNVSEKSTFSELLQQLNSDSYFLRDSAQEAIERLGPGAVALVMQAIENDELHPLGILHAVWIISHAGGQHAIDSLFKLAASDADTRVRAQAVRAIADLNDPILLKHRLNAGRGDEGLCRRLARLAKNGEPRLQLEVLIALARLHWSDAPGWLHRNWNRSDAALSQSALSHAAMIMLRSAENWPAVLALLEDDDNGSNNEPEVKPNLRTLALRALSNVANETVADGLLTRLSGDADPRRRREYFDLLARIYKKPAAWIYWGFRPPPRPANTVTWDYTKPIGTAMADALHDPDSSTRAFAVRRMLREAIPIPLTSLADWLRHESEADAVAAILEALHDRLPSDVRDMLSSIASNEMQSLKNRLAALDELVAGIDAESEQRLLEIGEALEIGPVLSKVLQEFGTRPSIDASRLLIRHLDSRNDDVRTAAIESLALRPVASVAARVTTMLKDSDVRVRRAAAILAGKLKVQSAVDLLLKYTTAGDLQLRSASLQSLITLDDRRALDSAVAALSFPECQSAALSYLGRYGDVTYGEVVTTTASRSRSVDVIAEAIHTLIVWQDKLEPQSADWKSLEQDIAAIQSASGLPLHWRMVGPVTSRAAAAILESTIATESSDVNSQEDVSWKRTMAGGSDSGVRLTGSESEKEGSVWLARTSLLTLEPSDVEFLASSEGNLTVWLNGREIFRRPESTSFHANSDRFDGTVKQGENRLLVRIGTNHGNARFQIQFRRKSSQAEHEQLMQKALAETGNIQRGRDLFMNADKALCIKCHRIGDGGARIGPDLTGIGSRFAPIHLVESILEPNRTVAPSYETVVVVLDSGLIVTGVKMSETDDVITLGDAEGKVHEILRSEIEELQVQPRSTMPEGLEKRLTDKEFVDLISYLVSEKKAHSQ